MRLRSLMSILILVVSCWGCSGANRQGTPSLGAQYDSALKEPNPETRGWRLINIGKKRAAAGDKSGADECFLSAAGAAEQIQNPTGKAKLLARIAEEQGQRGERAEAKRLLKQARTAYLQVDLLEARVAIAADTAVTYARILDQPGTASQDLQEAQQWIADISSPGSQVAAQVDVALAYLRIDPQSDEGQRLLSEAATEAKALGDPRGRTDALVQIAAAYAQLHQTEQSQRCIDDARQSVEGITDELSRGHALVKLARGYAQLGQSEQARQLLSTANALADKFEPTLRAELKQEVQRARADL